MKQDPAAEKAFGWILEMYAFSIASAIKPGDPITYDLHPEFMIQPPWDQTLTVRSCSSSKADCLVLLRLYAARIHLGQRAQVIACWCTSCLNMP